MEFKYIFLEPHIAAEREQDIVETDRTQQSTEEETICTIGWDHLSNDCMHLFIILIALTMVVCPFCSLLLQVLICFWSCLLFLSLAWV